jgi:hypothetical protein
MKTDLVEKVIQDIGTGHIAETLSGMSGANLHTLLMGVFAQRAGELAPRTIEAAYKSNRLVIPCPVEQRVLIDAEAAAYRTLSAEFRGVELSPVMPLGVNAVLGGVNQKNVLGTIRSCEVLADPTTALALECATERRAQLGNDPRSAARVRLATSVRCMRLQRFDDIPGFVPHFKIFALATAGRDVGSERFEIESLREHVRFYIEYVEALQSAGCDIRDLHVDLSETRIMRAIVAHHMLDSASIGRQVQVRDSSVFNQHGIAWPRRLTSMKDLPAPFVDTYRVGGMLALLSKIEDEVVMPLREQYPTVTFSFDLDRAAGMNYYTNACFKLWAVNKLGEQYPLADGGFADWTQKILQSRKERLLTSGIGTELILANFR